MAWSWTGCAVLAAVYSVEYGAIVSLEEEFLLKTLGGDYEEYQRRVPRWIPRLTPAYAATAGGFAWRGLRKEYLAAVSAFAMAGAVELGEHVHRLLLSWATGRSLPH